MPTRHRRGFQVAKRDPLSLGILPADTVSLGNGLFHIPTKTLLPHTPAFFTLNALPFEYQPDATCPEWQHFLEVTWKGDEESHMPRINGTGH